MTAHKHAKMIKAKADNMELVVFGNAIGGEWRECTFADLTIATGFYEFFLCLPQHKEACLHWLNGGDIQYDSGNEWILYDLSVDNPKYPLEDFTGFEFQFRIKPRKEKRWIGYNAKNNHTTCAMETKAEILNEYELCSQWQFIEIEVEL